MSGKKLSEELLKILACPLCKGELTYDDKAEEMICHESKLSYKIVNGMPIMLIDQSRKLEN